MAQPKETAGPKTIQWMSWKAFLETHPLYTKAHTPADFVVNQRPSDNESDSNLDLLGLGDVSTTFFPCIRSK
jgi:hypothetical protein